MSDRDIIDTIAAHCIGGCPLMCGPKFCPCNDQAKLILAALRAAGYAIVQLPEPSRGHSQSAVTEWLDGFVAIRCGNLELNWCSNTPSRCREIAAALLAAADKAEEGK